MHQIPFIGQVFSSKQTTIWTEDVSDFIVVNSPSFSDRFAVQINDDGLSGLGIKIGDFVVFRHQGWPNTEEQVVFIKFGDDCIVRILEGVWDSEPILKTASDKYEPVRHPRNQYIITGVLDAVIRKDEAKVQSIYDFQ